MRRLDPERDSGVYRPVPTEPFPTAILRPATGALPVLVSVPHAGRDYPPEVLALALHGLPSLRRLEDPLVDRLIGGAVDAGAGAAVALTPRAVVDCNRAEDEIDPTVVAVAKDSALSARARGGLGIVPGRIAGYGPLWRRPIAGDELENRLAQVHRPFHAAISGELARIHAAFGCALLIDCHSMPSVAGVADVVIGDRHGRTAAPWIRSELVRLIAAAGLTAAVNDPFAGGHVVERHGSPARGIHAVQLEIGRALYLRPGEPALSDGAPRIRDLIAAIAASLGNALAERSFRTAAE